MWPRLSNCPVGLSSRPLPKRPLPISCLVTHASGYEHYFSCSQASIRGLIKASRLSSPCFTRCHSGDLGLCQPASSRPLPNHDVRRCSSEFSGIVAGRENDRATVECTLASCHTSRSEFGVLRHRTFEGGHFRGRGRGLVESGRRRSLCARGLNTVQEDPFSSRGRPRPLPGRGRSFKLLHVPCRHFSRRSQSEGSDGQRRESGSQIQSGSGRRDGRKDHSDWNSPPWRQKANSHVRSKGSSPASMQKTQLQGTRSSPVDTDSGEAAARQLIDDLKTKFEAAHHDAHSALDMKPSVGTSPVQSAIRSRKQIFEAVRRRTEAVYTADAWAQMGHAQRRSMLVGLALDHDGVQGMLEALQEMGVTESGSPVTVDEKLAGEIISAFCRCRPAKMVFQALRELQNLGVRPDPLMYFLTINKLAQEGLVEEGHDLFKEMEVCLRANKRKPLRDSFTTMIAAAAKDGNAELAHEFKSKLEKLYRITPVESYACLIGMYVKKLDERKVFQLLEEMKKREVTPNVWVFNNMVKVYGQAGELEAAEQVLDHMQERGVRADAVTYNSLIHLFGRAERPDKVEEYLAKMITAGVKPTIETFNSRMDMFVKLGQTRRAIDVYQELLEEQRRRTSGEPPLKLNLYTYGTLMNLFGNEDQPVKATVWLAEMRAQGLKPNRVLYNTLMEAWARAGVTQVVLSLYNEFKAERLNEDGWTYAALILLHAVRGEEKRAWDLLKTAEGDVSSGGSLDKSPIQGLLVERCYCNLMLLYVRRCDFERLLELKNRWEERGGQPTVQMYNTVMEGVIEALDEGKRRWGASARPVWSPDASVRSVEAARASIESESQSTQALGHQHLEAIRRDGIAVLGNLLREMDERNVSFNSKTYALLIRYRLFERNYEAALSLWDELQTKRLARTPAVYVELLRGCLPEDAGKYYVGAALSALEDEPEMEWTAELAMVGAKVYAKHGDPGKTMGIWHQCVKRNQEAISAELFHMVVSAQRTNGDVIEGATKMVEGLQDLVSVQLSASPSTVHLVVDHLLGSAETAMLLPRTLRLLQKGKASLGDSALAEIESRAKRQYNLDLNIDTVDGRKKLGVA